MKLEERRKRLIFEEPLNKIFVYEELKSMLASQLGLHIQLPQRRKALLEPKTNTSKETALSSPTCTYIWIYPTEATIMTKAYQPKATQPTRANHGELPWPPSPPRQSAVALSARLRKVTVALSSRSMGEKYY